MSPENVAGRNNEADIYLRSAFQHTVKALTDEYAEAKKQKNGRN